MTNIVDLSRSKKTLSSLGMSVFGNYSGSNELDFSDYSELKNYASNGNWIRGSFTGYTGHVLLPKNLETVPAYVFARFTGTTTLHEGLKTIGTGAFQLSTISKIDIPSAVTSIGANAFNNATQLDTIISRNATPPTLGTNVFYGVNKETTLLKVPESSIPLYGTADQWKDFLNVNSTLPSKINLTYKITSKVWPAEFRETDNLEVSYEGVRIGEYYWMNKNFNHIEPKRQRYSANTESLIGGFENAVPLTQEILNKYLKQVVLNTDDYQVDIDQFTKDYGSYYSIETRNFMSSWGRIFEGNNTNPSDWKMPAMKDIRQLLAMSPFQTTEQLSHFDVMYALNATSTTNEMSKYVVSGKCGSTYWFNFGSAGGDKYGFGLMPNGARQHSPYHWSTTLCTEGTVKLPLDKGDIFQLFYVAYFAAQDGTLVIHDQISQDVVQNTWQTVRWTRLLTDEELGYKLYINVPNIDKTISEWNSFVNGDEIPLLNYLRNNCIDTDQVSIIKLGLNETVPAGYVELPHGYLRGFYVQHILDKPSSEVTAGDVVRFAYNVQDSALQFDYLRPENREALKVCSNSTRSVVVPFRAESNVTLYPNPVQNELNVSGEGIEKVTIYDLSGRQLASVSNTNKVQVSDLTAGTYVVKVLSAAGESVHKIMKK